MRRLSGGCLLAVGLLAGCHGSAPKAEPPPRQIEVVTLTPRQVRETGEYLGGLISRQSVNVLPQVAGYVRNILVRPGASVGAGTPLLEVDARQETAALQSAEAQETSVASSRELARQTLARTESLYKEGLVSAQELERARASLASAQAQTRSAAAQVSQRRVQLQYYAVRAPFAGRVGDVLVRIGDYVGASTVLTSVAQSDVLEVSAAVPPERARTLGPDTPVELLDARGELLLATRAYFVAPQADSRTQLVDVKAVFRNTVGLRPNELVRTRLVYSVRDALEVPALAVVRQSGQPFVFALEQREGRTVVARRAVTLGPLGEQAYVVEKGLAPGDRIAVSSIQALRDGAVVKPVERAAPPNEAASGQVRRSGAPEQE